MKHAANAPATLFSATVDVGRLSRLVEVSRILNSTTNIDTLLHLIIDEAADLTGAEAASILLLDPKTRELRFKATSAGSDPELIDRPVPISGSIAGSVLQANRPLLVNNAAQDPRWNPEIAKSINFQTRSILCVPMHNETEPVGVLEAINKHDNHFTEEDTEVLGILADLAGVAVDKARLIEELRRANRQLNELDRLKSDFIALASHELRTPLSIILGYVSFLREEAQDETASQLDSVLRAAVKLRSLIEDMVNLQYVDTGGTALTVEPVDFNQLVADMVHERDETADAKNITAYLTRPSEPVFINADLGMIEAAVSNLVNNAIKFTPDGGKIYISVELRDDEVWLTVLDTGIGIEVYELERIFDRFYQVEPHLRRHYEGMGLGLAISKELVELHGGRIWADSQLGQGSKFVIALPIQQALA